MKPSMNRIQWDSSSEFVKRIENLLHRQTSLGESIGSLSKKEMSQTNFQENLLNTISDEYLEKQDTVRLELEKKQRYLTDFQQTQDVAQQELNDKYEDISQRFQTLSQRYEQVIFHQLNTNHLLLLLSCLKECLRQRKLRENVADLLSIVEEHNSVVSDAEILVKRQLIKYDIQMNYLIEKFSRLRELLSSKENFKSNEKQIDQTSMENFQPFIHYYRTQIDTLKQQIRPPSQNNTDGI